ECAASGPATQDVVGLSNGDSSQSWQDLDYAFYLEGSPTLQIYEAGSNVGSFGTYAAGDRLRLSIESGVVKYYRNGSLLRESTRTPVLPLWIDTSLCQALSLVLNPVLSGVPGQTAAHPPTISPGS